ncbi:MAG: glycosyl transferase [Legionellales bacterium]|nr:glycosyl transferase [Legionellales bacterium]
MPEISVIIPTYNRISFIERAINSVLNQSCMVNEIIIVDDGSKDGTKQLIKKKYPQITYIYQENKGVSTARNRGIMKTNYDWVCFLDSDDAWHTNKIEIQQQKIKNNPKALICHTDEIWYQNGKILNQQKKHKKFGGYIFKRCLPFCIISPSSVIINKEVFDKIGFFDEKLPACEDYDLWLRICSKYPVSFINEALTYKYGGHSDQLSRKYWGIDRFRIIALENIIQSNTLDSIQTEEAKQELLKKIDIFLKGAAKYDRNEYHDKCVAIKNKYA